MDQIHKQRAMSTGSMVGNKGGRAGGFINDGWGQQIQQGCRRNSENNANKLLELLKDTQQQQQQQQHHQQQHQVRHHAYSPMSKSPFST